MSTSLSKKLKDAGWEQLWEKSNYSEYGNILKKKIVKQIKKEEPYQSLDQVKFKKFCKRSLLCTYQINDPRGKITMAIGCI